MPIRVGIDLSPVTCRIVALDPARLGRDDVDTRVTFATMAGAGDTTPLASLRGRHAAVVVWAARADHRQVVVADGSYEHMQAEAQDAVRNAGRLAERRLTDIAPVPKRVGDSTRRTVLLASAAAADVAALLVPLVEAGIKIDRVLTPAAALLSLARARRTKSNADSRALKAESYSSRPSAVSHQFPREVLEAYVVIDETCGCVALVQDGVLLGAVDLPWGYVAELGNRRARDDVAVRLADDLSAFMADCRLDRQRLRHVCVCGGVPEMRSMAMTLMERLDVEVEPLDSLFAIDAAHLPGNADQFRERAAELRLAWAAAADPRPPIDLLRMGRRRTWSARLSRAAVIAGTAAGLALGWEVQGRWPPAVAPAPSATPRVSEPASGRPIFRTVREPMPLPSAIARPSSVRPANEPTTALSEPAASRPVFRAVREPIPLPAAVTAPSPAPRGGSPRAKPREEARRQVAGLPVNR